MRTRGNAPRDACCPGATACTTVCVMAQANNRRTAELLDGNKYTRIRCDTKISGAETGAWIPLGQMTKLVELGGRVDVFVKVCLIVLD